MCFAQKFRPKKKRKIRDARVWQKAAQKVQARVKGGKKNPAKRHACENKKEFLEIYDLKDTHDDFQHTHDTINTK